MIRFFMDQLSPVSENPAREVRVLLGYLENRDPDFYFFNPDYSIPEAIKKKLETLIQRRLNHEPLSKIIGRREFYGRWFKVTKDTLDPRPETELFIDHLLPMINDLPKPITVLDLGTGTGCIALTLLLESQYILSATLVDISEKALNIARENALLHQLEKRVICVQSDWCQNLDHQQFSVIVSNPPYIATHETLDKNVYDFDPHAALFGGGDGFDAYRTLIPQLRKHLAPNGLVAVEFGQGQEEKVISLFEAYGFKCIALVPDLQGIMRMAIFL